MQSLLPYSRTAISLPRRIALGGPFQSTQPVLMFERGSGQHTGPPRGGRWRGSGRARGRGSSKAGLGFYGLANDPLNAQRMARPTRDGVPVEFNNPGAQSTMEDEWASVTRSIKTKRQIEESISQQATAPFLGVGGANQVSAELAKRTSAASVDRNRQPIHTLATEGDVAAVEALLDGEAAQNDNPEIPSKLIDTCDKYDESPLVYAVATGQLEMVKLLIRKGADVNHRTLSFWTPLHRAAHGTHHDIVQVLLAAGATVDLSNKQGKTPLLLAASQPSSAPVVQFLLDAGAKLDQKTHRFHKTPLHIAGSLGDPSTVSLMLERGADPHTADDAHRTVLHDASEKNRLDTINIVCRYIRENQDEERLVKAVNRPDKGGFTPLHVAASEDNHSVVKALIDYGAKLDATTSMGKTPLHLAATRGRVGPAKILLAAGADHSVETPDRSTALHFAAALRSLELVKVLVEAKASLRALNAAGSTPLQCAERRHNPEGEEVARYLREVI